VLAAGEAVRPAHSLAEKEIVATVGDEPVHAGELDRLLHRAFRGREVGPDVLPWLQAQVLEEIVDRRLVLAYAQRTNSAPAAEEVDRELAQWKARLASQHPSLADYLHAQSMDESDLRRQVMWNLVWGKFVARYVTHERVEAYFQAHHREFDGSQLSVSHILLRPPKGSGPAAMEDLVRRATAIRQEIVAGKTSFGEAARKYSNGPSAKDGGELGYVPRHGVMDEAFSRAAFALEAGQVSQPVRTPFGVHLIRGNHIRPGSKQVADVRQEVEDALARELLEKLARLERGYTPVEYTGKSAYFKPDTRELVRP
jgi:parvulin-like peptidyl-prolyl isomerase